MKSCRACPVVRAAGVRCDTLRSRAGMGDDWAAHFDQAIFVITRARRALQRIYDSMTKAGSRMHTDETGICTNRSSCKSAFDSCRFVIPVVAFALPEAGSREPANG
jgi:hypothetical protein